MELLGYEKEEIIDALTIIHEICCANICDECPFDKHGECNIRNAPEDWHIHSNLSQWRAFD